MTVFGSRYRAPRTVMLTVQVLALGVVSAGSAEADPGGSLDLDRVPSERPQIYVLGASSYGLLYRTHNRYGNPQTEDITWVKPTRGAAYQVDDVFSQLSGDKVFGQVHSSYPVHYQVIGTPVTRRCDASPQPAGAFTPFGWISADGDRVEAGATGCRVSAKYPPVVGGVGVADERGYVTVTNIGHDGEQRLTYRSYADPTHATVIADGGRNRQVGAMALAGSVVTWAQADYSEIPLRDRSFVVRSSTDGSVAPVVTELDRLVGTTAIVGDATGWAGCYDGSIYPPARCSGGTLAADGSRTERPETRTVAGDGGRFIFDTYGAAPGVDAASALGGTAPLTRLATVGLLPPTAYLISLGASGAAYVDSQGPGTSISRRGYTRSGSTIRLGPQVPVVAETKHRTVSRDGRRTAYVDAHHDLWLVTDDGIRTKVFDSVDLVAQVIGNVLVLSGSRLLWLKGRYSGTHCDPPDNCGPAYHDTVYMIYDLRTGKNIELPTNHYWPSMTMWGSYLVYMGNENTIWRRDLSSGRVLQVKAAGGPEVISIAVHGDYVAWSTCARSEPPSSAQCAGSIVAYRNMTTRAAAVQLVTTQTRRVRLSGGHVAYDLYPSTAYHAGALRLLRLGTRVTGAVTTVFDFQPFDLHDETISWLAADGIARIGPTSSFRYPPRYLGNALGSSIFTPNGDGRADTWQPEFSISKALPTCIITIRSGPKIRRILVCASNVGSARATWNGRDQTGRPLPKGRYTWTLTGRDPDGPLRWWNGNPAPIHGTVTLA